MDSVVAGKGDASYDGHSIPSLHGEAALVHSRMERALLSIEHYKAA